MNVKMSSMYARVDLAIRLWFTAVLVILINYGSYGYVKIEGLQNLQKIK